MIVIYISSLHASLLAHKAPGCLGSRLKVWTPRLPASFTCRFEGLEDADEGARAAGRSGPRRTSPRARGPVRSPFGTDPQQRDEQSV